MNIKTDRRGSALKALAPGLLILALAVLPGCASKEPGQPIKIDSPDSAAQPAQDMKLRKNAADQKDCFEPVNRGIFKVNEVVDGVLLKPLAHIYRGVMPEFGQKTVRNILTNLASPVVFLNSVLQADANNAGKTLGRFVINSTLGVAGAFDVASEFGIEKQHKKDFGQTLGVYGVGEGTYIVLPLLGPSDLRDSLGLIVDLFSDPFTYILTSDESFARFAVAGIVKRADLIPFTDRVYRDSLDPYATFRSVYLQNREKFIRDYKVDDKISEKYPGK